jgi:hypothetical protein
MADLTMTVTVDDVIFEADSDDGFKWLGQQQVRKSFAEVKAFKEAAEHDGPKIVTSGL